MSEPVEDPAQTAQQEQPLASAGAELAIDENPYSRLSPLEASEGGTEENPKRRPSSLSAHINSAPGAALPPLQQPLPEKYTSPASEQPSIGEAMTPKTPEQPTPAPRPEFVAPAATSNGTGPEAQSASEPQSFGEKLSVMRQERPEVLVLAAFAGGVIIAAILKGLASR